MLDYHYETFLTVCKTLNYTRAGELMNMSQPAVSQHIAYLEDQLDTKLFIYKNKKLSLTEEGRYLYNKLLWMENFSKKTLEELGEINFTKVNLGCTLSISDYLVPSFFIDMFHKEKGFRLNVLVENTETLVNYLVQGKIDGAFVEGDFNQRVFSSIPYKEARIVGICSPDFELADKQVSFQDLFNKQIIIREPGSGTRSSFETILANEQIELSSFKNQTILGSIDLIKRVVESNVGISFLFDVCVEKELEEGTLKKLDFGYEFEAKMLNFIYLTSNPTTDFILRMEESFQRTSH
ncbi:MAG: LysR family transcriptional regulator [Lactobacillales bacterium]|jgi:DNA-binding transcriptional LysR family regulator|nr:LysR family transcriptional regulator [Lactobacillales bacterium]